MVFINAGKFRRYHGESLLSHLLDFKTIALNIRDLWRALSSVKTASSIMRKFKPDIVFSKGSFVAVPVGIAARLKRIPIVTHDSDAVAGLANKIISRWAVIDATGMPSGTYPYPKDHIRYVGVPIAADIIPITPAAQESLKKAVSLPEDAPLLLIAGGGNGSKEINDAVVSISEELLSANITLQIVHITGEGNRHQVRQDYDQVLSKEQLKRVKIIGFTNEFAKYSGAADLIVCRAGATSLAEIAVLGKASIIIPSTFLAGGHQLKNAEILKSHNAAVIVESPIESQKMLALIGDLLTNPERREDLSKNISKLAKPDATRDLAKIIVEVARKSQTDA